MENQTFRQRLTQLVSSITHNASAHTQQNLQTAKNYIERKLQTHST